MMASLQKDPSGNYHFSFRFGGARHKRSLKTSKLRLAQAARARVEENIRLVLSGRLEIADDVDLPTFLLSDGKLNQKPKPTVTLRLGELYKTYVESLPADSLETTTLRTIGLHTRTLVRELGSRKALRLLTVADLQHYVTTRSKEPGRNGNISAGTIRTEISTLGSIWNWALCHEYVSKPFPKQGLVFPKLNDKPPFQTWEQIERRIKLENPSPDSIKALWHCLYLDTDQIQNLLDFIKASCPYPYLFPMCALAAYTGARRSEICRSKIADFDLVRRGVVIHERKRSRTKRTTRVVPLTASLTEILRDWFDQNQSSPCAFPEDHRVPRLRKPKQVAGCVSPDEASFRLTLTLADGPWETVPGWHTLRHSFISNCASNGVDQRFIDAWVGHQTDEQRRRYRHLFPESQQTAIDSVF